VPLKLGVLVAALALAQEPSPLDLFVYSRDTLHGFKDEFLDTFRRELGKHVESFTEVAYSREEAQVSVQFLGRGDLEVELGDAGEPVRYLWRSDENAARTWALVRVARKGQLGELGVFSKEFSVDGGGGRDLSRLAKSIADWIRENSSAIRAR
jgi:hypothetical protein